MAMGEWGGGLIIEAHVLTFKRFLSIFQCVLRDGIGNLIKSRVATTLTLEFGYTWPLSASPYHSYHCHFK